MDENNQVISGQRKVIRISKKKFIWFIVIVLILAIGYLIRPQAFQTQVYESLPTVPSLDGMSQEIYPDDGAYDRYNYNYGYQEPTIEDTREFLKISYSSKIQTRKVQEVTKDVSNMVKGADGRIDQLNSSEKYGFVRFVVAKDKFEGLREQIEGITYAKLYTENISSQNLLSEKQGIEKETTSVLTTLDSLKKELSSLNAQHTKTLNSISAELARIQTELNKVRASISATTDSQLLVSLRQQETVLLQRESAQNVALNKEDENFQVKKQNLDSQIKNWNENLDNVNERDEQFGNNVETVNGYVNVSWVSIWDLMKIYSPIHPTIAIIIVIVLVWLMIRRKKFVPQIVWE